MHKLLVACVLTSLLLPISNLQARTPNDAYFGDQWYLPRIDAPSAWDTTTGNKDLIIAVLDTGVDLNHPDLVGNVWVNGNEITGNSKDDDGNGFIDDTQGWDFVDNDSAPEPMVGSLDSAAMSHGTLVSGLIAAQSNNAIGYSGVLWNAKIMPLRVLNSDGVGGEEATAKAVDYAVANGAKVINMSFAGSASGSRLKTSVRKAYEAGVVVVAALGNDGQDVDVDPVYPACFQSDIADWVLGVTATDPDDNETEFTNYGATCADLSAPGIDILGLGYQAEGEQIDQAYGGPWNGTSAASPLVAGSAGLLLSKYPNLSPQDVFTILKLSVDPINDTLSGVGSIGVGRLNIAKALSVAASFTPATDATSSIITDKTNLSNSDKSIPITEDEHTNEHYSFLALGSGVGELPNVEVYRADGTAYATFTAYTPNFKGGVRVVTEDLDSDAIPEVITAAGPSGGPHIRVFKPYGAVISEFFAYANTSDQGVNIAVGDVDADGVADIVTSVGAGVSNDIIVWSLTGEEKYRFTATGFTERAPLSVDIADVDSDWDKEIVVYAEVGESRVQVYNIDGTKVTDFIAYPEHQTGVRLDTADLDGDYRDEIITTGGAGEQAKTRIFNKSGAYWGGFVVPTTNALTSYRLSVTDIDIDGQIDIVLAPLATAGEVTVYAVDGEKLMTIGTSLVGSVGGYLAAW
jgi:subtilisin family serine protease